MRRIVILYIIIFSFSNSSFSQIFRNVLDKTEIYSDSLIRDEKAFLNSAIRIKNGKQLLSLVGLSAATVGLINNDVEIYRAVKLYQDKHPWLSKLSPLVTLGGDNYSVISVTGAFFAAGIIFKDSYTIKTGELLFRSLIHTAIFVRMGKLFFGRARPYATMRDGNWNIDYNGVYDKWNWFPESLNGLRRSGDEKYKYPSNYDSFPSGHTSVAFTMATVIAKRYNNTKIVPVISYTLATLVGLSRITEDAHWLSDCIVGGALGYGIGSLTVKLFSNSNWTIIPFFNSFNAKGISMLYNF